MKPRSPTLPTRRDRWSRLAVLGAVPGALFIGHFFYGAYLPLPSMVLTLAAAAGLAAALTEPAVRADLSSIRPMLPLAALLAVVLGVAALTQTAWTPGGPHPLWAWAGLPPASTIDRSATTLEMIKLAGLACLFALGCILGARSDRARTTLGLIVVIGGVYALVSLILFLTGTQVGGGMSRLLGGFYSTNSAATVLGMLSALVLAWLMRRWRRSGGVKVIDRLSGLAPIVAVFVLLWACLLLTASRAGIASTLLASASLLAWDALDGRKARLGQLAAAGLVIGVIAGVYLLGNTQFLGRFADIGSAADIRGALTTAHWAAFLDSPLFGYGLGTYSAVNNQIMTSDNYEALAATTILHNAYLQWLEEAGVAGAVPMFLLVAIILAVTTWRTIRRRSNRTLLSGLLAASLIVLLHAAVDVSLQMPTLAGFWALLLGLGYAFAQAPAERR